MALPGVPDTYFTERQGIQHVANEVTRLRCIWRETPNADVGIDGQIELVDEDGRATGQVVAAQVKSGESYFRKQDSSGVYYTPSDKHREYWAAYPVPVLLVLFNPTTGSAYWIDARQKLRSPLSSESPALLVPWTRKLADAGRSDIFPPSERLLEVDELVKHLALTEETGTGSRINLFELFMLSLVDFNRKVFFATHLVLEIVETKSLGGYSVGMSLHNFMDQFVNLLVSQGLVYLDYSDYLISLDEYRVQPVFIAPLTPRGLELRDRLYSHTGSCKPADWYGMNESMRLSLSSTLREIEELRTVLLKQIPPTN